MDLHGAEQQVACGRTLAENGYDIFSTVDGRKVRDVAKPHPQPQGMSDQVIAILRRQ